jgi:crotonobetainyl-CoA:carnitine CoA-transferase CaiB-like acyl-CoA transferase
VVEMVRIIAGPTVGVILASFGADVIRVNCSRLADQYPDQSCVFQR